MEKFNKHDIKMLERSLEYLIERDSYSSIETIEIFPLFLIEKHSNVLDWVKISRFYCLSQEFIYKFANLLSWDQLSRNEKQIIPEDIFEERIEELDICFLFDTNRIPINILKKFISYINYKLEIRKKHGGISYLPYKIKLGTPIVVGNFFPNESIKSRYATVQINENNYRNL